MIFYTDEEIVMLEKNFIEEIKSVEKARRNIDKISKIKKIAEYLCEFICEYIPNYRIV